MYILSGRIRVDHGVDGAESFEIGKGDYAYFPRRAMSRALGMSLSGSSLPARVSWQRIQLLGLPQSSSGSSRAAEKKHSCSFASEGLAGSVPFGPPRR